MELKINSKPLDTMQEEVQEKMQETHQYTARQRIATMGFQEPSSKPPTLEDLHAKCPNQVRKEYYTPPLEMLIDEMGIHFAGQDFDPYVPRDMLKMKLGLRRIDRLSIAIIGYQKDTKEWDLNTLESGYCTIKASLNILACIIHENGNMDELLINYRWDKVHKLDLHFLAQPSLPMTSLSGALNIEKHIVDALRPFRTLRDISTVDISLTSASNDFEKAQQDLHLNLSQPQIVKQLSKAKQARRSLGAGHTAEEVIKLEHCRRLEKGYHKPKQPVVIPWNSQQPLHGFLTRKRKIEELTEDDIQPTANLPAPKRARRYKKHEPVLRRKLRVPTTSAEQFDKHFCSMLRETEKLMRSNDEATELRPLARMWMEVWEAAERVCEKLEDKRAIMPDVLATIFRACDRGDWGRFEGSVECLMRMWEVLGEGDKRVGMIVRKLRRTVGRKGASV